ncbi:bifunctional diguanylate cyclase/phosphodiesterase [Kosakonia pseudosacchari]|uniref:bifunctional diguanylate cyclase/phosphodiesterase n=1 Tax=Kosakonia pseudosacchari TaxID=1646340 RepID=UPI0018824E04|nr:EAL domain-containing protein [Kosakonia pseudosacchari]QOV63297.1 EAL domain-containing protein [Kosakonia pseudosacchari]
MSLYKQLLLGICLFTLVLFCGNFFITLDSSREQYSAQLSAHSQDAATALGVSLTGNIDDPAMVELMVNAIFDSGYFYSIRVVDMNSGKPLIERQSDPQSGNVPQWFERLVHLKPGTGEAIIMRGWIQAARVEVVSHPMFALTRLWRSMIASFLWLTGCSLLCLICAMLLLRRSLRPLDHIAVQAASITRREFRHVPNVPKTPELRRVVEASNMMVSQLQMLFSEQAQRTDALREAAYHDSLTGLNNRRAFDIHLQSILRDDEMAFGYVILLRVRDLAGLNLRMGGEKTDALLREVATILRETKQIYLHQDGFIARIRGGEFAIVTADMLPQEHQVFMNALTARVSALYKTGMSDRSPLAYFASLTFQPGDTLQNIMAQADQALTAAETNAHYVLQPGVNPAAGSHDDHHRWLTRLENVLQAENFVLFGQPVVTCDSTRQVLHHKILARIKTEEGEMIPAGRFMPWFLRFSLSARMDAVMLKQTLRFMSTSHLALALSISGESIASDENLAVLLQLLKNAPQQAKQLTLELDENELPDPERVSVVVNKLNAVGCRLGIQHFGGRFHLIGNLPQWGLAWIKIDGSYIHHIDKEEDKRFFIEAMYWAARQINLPLIAEQVETSEELAILNKIGIYGAMGRYFGDPSSLVN